MTLYDHATPNPQGHRDITPAQVHAAGSTVRLVDVREAHEFVGELGHAMGAELVPLGTVPAHADDWDQAADIVLLCRSGARSAQAAAWLTAQGFQRAMNMTGGMLAWNAAALPVVKS